MYSSSPPGAAKTKSAWWTASVLAALLAATAIFAGLTIRHRRLAAQATPAPRAASSPSPAAIEDAVAAGALAKYLVRLRQQVAEHEAAFERLKDKRVLAWDIHELADIEANRQVVLDFLTTNERLAEFIQHGEGYVRGELDTARVTGEVRDSVLALYSRTQGPLVPFHIRVRDCDEIIGRNAMAVLYLLESNWSRWTRDKATGRIDFTQPDLYVAFKDYVVKIDDAGNQRAQAEAQLVQYQKQHPQR
jgi:hypothetical protein